MAAARTLRLDGHVATGVRSRLAKRLDQCLRLRDRPMAIAALYSAIAAVDAAIASPSDAGLSAAAIASWTPLREFFGDVDGLLSKRMRPQPERLATVADIGALAETLAVRCRRLERQGTYTASADLKVRHGGYVATLEGVIEGLRAAEEAGDLPRARAAYGPVRDHKSWEAYPAPDWLT